MLVNLVIQNLSSAREESRASWRPRNYHRVPQAACWRPFRAKYVDVIRCMVLRSFVGLTNWSARAFIHMFTFGTILILLRIFPVVLKKESFYFFVTIVIFQYG
jgi:hypothetical protein